MATKAQREEIAAKTDEVRTLMASGDEDEAAELVKDTEDLIRSTKPARDHNGYLKILAKAATPSHGELATADYHAIVGMDKLIDTGVKRVRDTVDAGVKMGDAARQVADILLEARLQMRNKDGLPDLIASSKYTKNIAGEMYSRAKENISDDDHERKEQHDSIAKAVSNRMVDVLVGYLRSLDHSSDHVREFYPQAMLQFPTKTPTEAVYALYERHGYRLPTKTRTERARESTQEQRGLAAVGKAALARKNGGSDELEDLMRVTKVIHTAVSRASSMSKKQRATLKNRIQATITELAAEAAKL